MSRLAKAAARVGCRDRSINIAAELFCGESLAIPVRINPFGNYLPSTVRRRYTLENGK